MAHYTRVNELFVVGQYKMHRLRRLSLKSTVTLRYLPLKTTMTVKPGLGNSTIQ